MKRPCGASLKFRHRICFFVIKHHAMRPGLAAIVSFLGLLWACSSGKIALKQGDYYEAVLSSVSRLRQNPDHKKSREVLSLSYRMAVDYLETSAQNQIASGAPFRFRSAVQNYERINTLYEEIMKSPGALTVIPKPESRFKELADVKNKAAEESYEAGLQAMMKNTRPDAKEAYFLFSDANRYSPGYREAIEMIQQAEYNATLRVSFEETNVSRENFSVQPAVLRVQRQFLKFYTLQEAAGHKDPMEQHIKLIYRGCETPARPTQTASSEEVERQVKVGEKEVNGKKEDVMETVKAKVTIYTLSISSRCTCFTQINDLVRGSMLMNDDINGFGNNTVRWATFEGDVRALSKDQRQLTQVKNRSVSADQTEQEARQELLRNINAGLRNFYQRY